MPESRREHILASAVAVVERHGVHGLTLDAVAAEASITKPGLLYHFPGREALLAAVNDHVAAGWERAMRAHAGGGAEEVDAARRHAAYVALCASASTRAELLLVLESITDRTYAQPYSAAVQRWTPDPDEGADDADVDAFVARLAADGLWMHEAASGRPLAPELRRRVLRRLTGGRSPRGS